MPSLKYFIAFRKYNGVLQLLFICKSCSHEESTTQASEVYSTPSQHQLAYAVSSTALGELKVQQSWKKLKNA